jgi:hypothetical protein
VDDLIEAVQRRAGLLLDPGPPQVDQFLGRFRRLLPCQALAHHQRKRVFQRCVLALLERAGDLVGKALLQHRIKVVGHAGHGACTERFHTRLLDRLIDGTGLLACRQVAGMHLLVVVGQAHGHGIGHATCHAQIVSGGILGHLRQAGTIVGQPGRFGAERAGQFRLVGNGLHGERQGALEVVRRCITVLGHIACFSQPWVSGAWRLRVRSIPGLPNPGPALRRSSAGRTRPPGRAPARRTCSGRSRGRRSPRRRRWWRFPPR